MNKTHLICALTATALLTGCGNDSQSTNSNLNPTAQTTINGTAATGLAMAGGTVEVTNANGKKSSTTINADGTYSVGIDKASPYLVKATTKASAGVEAKSEYGYATDATASNVNVTQLTTLALFDAAGQVKPDSVYADWANKKTAVTEAKVMEAAKKVVANLSTALKAQGYTDAEISTLNVLNQKFTPATATSPTGDRFDKVLDVVKPTYSCTATACTGSYLVNGTTVNWNTNVSTAGVNISMGGAGPAGSGGACMVNITVMGVGNKVCLNNFPENAACSEANAAVKAQAAAYAQIGASVSYAPAASCAGATTTINYAP